MAGAILIVGSVFLRFLAELAAELFTMRLSVLGAAFGLVVFFVASVGRRDRP